MARIFNLFGRSPGEDGLGAGEGDNRPRKSSLGYDALGIEGADVEIFEGLAEAQRAIDLSLSSVATGLGGVHGLLQQITTLQNNFTTLFDNYRRQTADRLSLEQDRDRIEAQLHDKARELEDVRSDRTTVRREVEGLRGQLAKVKAELDDAVNRAHVTEIARKDLERQLIGATASLRTVTGEAEAARLELAAQRQRIDADTAKIDELVTRHNAAYERSLLLTERCDAQESGLKASAEQVAALQTTIEVIGHERDGLRQQVHQREVETAQLQGDLTKAFERYQADLRARDRDITELRADNESLRASGKIQQQLSQELKADNDAKVVHIRQQNERIARLELTTGQLEARYLRAEADLGEALTARAQTDQSRTAIAARVETLGQALRSREADVYRLETELAHAHGELEAQSSRERDTTTTLEARIFELERELAAQKNDTAYYYAQAELRKQPDSRDPIAD